MAQFRHFRDLTGRKNGGEERGKGKSAAAFRSAVNEIALTGGDCAKSPLDKPAGISLAPCEIDPSPSIRAGESEIRALAALDAVLYVRP